MDAVKGMQSTHLLDMRYQETLHETKQVVAEEDTRRHRLRSVVLRDQVASLEDKMSQKDDKMAQLAQQCDELRTQLEDALQRLRDQERQIRDHVRTQANLEAEMQSLSGVSSDSAKLLSEKLALTRELGLLKPETEHLRSQLTHHKEILSQKLALERQIDTLEVQLANEKRAVERANQKQAGKEGEIETELRTQVQDLEKQLAASKRETERATKQAKSKKGAQDEELKQRIQELEEQLEAAASGSSEDSPAANANDARVDELLQKISKVEAVLAQDQRLNAEMRKTLEAQVADAQQERDTFKQKLRETRAELKAARVDAKQAKPPVATVVFDSPVEAAAATKPQARRKRRANEMSHDQMMLHTPNNTDARSKRPLKKRAMEHTLVGEKSTFSITPFLNKTVNFAEATLDLSTSKREQARKDLPSAESVTEEVEPSEAPASVAVATSTAKPRGRPAKAKVLGESSPSKRNLPSTKSRKAALSKPTLDQVMEEKDEAAAEQENRPLVATKTVLKLKATTEAETRQSSSGIISNTSTATATSLLLEPEPKKKKRKLLSGTNKTSTLFDEDDAEAAGVASKAPAAAPAAGPTKRKALGGARGLGGKAAAPLLGRAAFAMGTTFSPLKKDRRGVHASFLA